MKTLQANSHGWRRFGFSDPLHDTGATQFNKILHKTDGIARNYMSDL